MCQLFRCKEKNEEEGDRIKAQEGGAYLMKIESKSYILR